MKKPVIYVKKCTKIPCMDFCVTSNGCEYFLFSMPYIKNVYYFFEKGKSVEQLRKYRKWKKNDVLSRLVEKRIPYELGKLRKEGVIMDD